MLSEILRALGTLNILIRPFGVEEKELKEHGECIVYVYNPSEKSNRFSIQFRIISKSLERCLEIHKLIEKLFVGLGDKVNINKCTYIKFGSGYTAKENESNTIHLLFNVDFVGVQ